MTHHTFLSERNIERELNEQRKEIIKLFNIILTHLKGFVNILYRNKFQITIFWGEGCRIYKIGQIC